MPHFPVRLAPLVRRRLVRFLKQHPEAKLALDLIPAVREITRIVQDNARADRHQKFKQPNKPARVLTPTQYIDRVISYWANEAAWWYRLKKHDEDVWHELRKWLERGARQIEWGRSQPQGYTLEDFVQRAIEKFLVVEYPFDVDFAPWAFLILKRVIFGVARDKTDVLDNTPASLDELWDGDEGEGGETRLQPADARAEAFVRALADRAELERAVTRLTRAEREVFLLFFIEELSDEEIARKIKRARATVHARRHRALARLYYLLTGKKLKGKRSRQHQSP